MATTRPSPGFRRGRGSVEFLWGHWQAPGHLDLSACVKGSSLSGSTRARHHGGQAALPVALLALALLLSVGLVARWGQAALASSRAQAAADAAALATLATADIEAIMGGVVPGAAVALGVVRDADGVLEGFEVRIDGRMAHVEVVVEIDGQRAAAAAEMPIG
ncbi:pilus assembly protein TadG-related protein [Candidatus Poriferisodalis sp.]|uniref:pilus assembly protein TadG-related protein n=1 Tax=Candidatus Poriferisodalis sp. TaxID=3101277 RepID=UPI003B022260